MAMLSSPSGCPVMRKDCAQLIMCWRHARSDFNVGVLSVTGGMLGKDSFIVAAVVVPLIAAMMELVCL